MREHNQHGLSREIPADVRREVRCRAGFGCVVCGSALAQYYHFDPEFIEAREHDPDGIAYLCEHCRAHAGSNGAARRFPLEKLRDSVAHPKAREAGFSRAEFLMTSLTPTVHLGTMTACNFRHLFRIDGRQVFSIEPPEEPRAPFRLQADIINSSGEQIFRVVDNAWEARSGNWYVQCKGRSITIQGEEAEIHMHLHPPADFCIERIRMRCGKYLFGWDGREMQIETDCNRFIGAVSGGAIDGCIAVLEIAENRLRVGTRTDPFTGEKYVG
jgi:hypothetical protein